MVVNKPNLFIVGAPKCGTSFLYEFFVNHPEVYLPSIKEPNYFDKDLNYISPRLSLEQYLALYNKAGNEKIWGEASPWYLYSSVAADEIYRFNSEAKIIIMLRNPIEYMHSLHSENLYQGNEIIEDFEEALTYEENRINNSNIYANSNPKEGVYYKDTAKFTKQIKRYFDKFGRDNVHIIILDDLKSNPKKVCIDVLNFLKIDSIVPDYVNSVNQNKEIKNKTLRELVARPPSILRSIIKILIPFHTVRITIQDLIKKLNTKEVKRKPISQQLSNQLKKEFEEEIQLLSKLINRDLSHWVK